MVRKAYVSSVQDIRKAEMTDALVKALDPQLAGTAPKMVANLKPTALEHNFFCSP